MDRSEIIGIISLIFISVIGGILVPQLILPGVFSGVDETHPSWALLVMFMYMGIFASIGGSVIMMLLFGKKRSRRAIAMKMLLTTIITLVWLIFVSYIGLFIVQPEVSNWSGVQTLEAYFQYPAYSGLYVWDPSSTWFLSVLIYNIAYIVMVMRIEQSK